MFTCIGTAVSTFQILTFTNQDFKALISNKFQDKLTLILSEVWIFIQDKSL